MDSVAPPALMAAMNLSTAAANVAVSADVAVLSGKSLTQLAPLRRLSSAAESKLSTCSRIRASRRSTDLRARLLTRVFARWRLDRTDTDRNNESCSAAVIRTRLAV